MCLSPGRQTRLLKRAFNLKLLHKNRMNRFALMKCRPYLYIRLVLPSVCPLPTCLPSRSPPAGWGFLWGSVGSTHPPPRISGWVLLRCPLPPRPTPKPSIRLLSSIQSDENTVNALIGVFFGFISYHVQCCGFNILCNYL